MKYFELNSNEFDEDRPGVSSDMIRNVLTKMADQVGGEGEMSVLGADTAGPAYFVLLENPRHVDVLQRWLTKRNFWFQVHDHLPQAGPDDVPRDPTMGIIFFRLARQQIRPGAVRGAVHGIAAVINKLFGYPTYADFFPDPDDQAVYWIGFSDTAAAGMFAQFLGTQDVPAVHRDALPGVGRPQLQLVDFHATQQAAPVAEEASRGGRHQAPQTDQQAEGRGFAVVGEMVRRRLRRGDGPGWRANMEKRLSARFGFTPRRRGDDGS